MTFVSCEDSTVAAANISRAAHQFEIFRRVVFYNGITNELGERVIWEVPNNEYPPEETTITYVFTMDESTMSSFPGELCKM